MEEILKYAKALVPVIILAVLAGLSNIGITKEMSIEDVVTMLITSGFVYLVPNRKV